MREKYYLKEDKKAFLYPEEYLKIFDLANSRQRHTILFLINTGARINEIRNVDEQDIDKKRMNIKLRITKVRAKLKERRPTPREIPISKKFCNYIKRHINIYKIHSTPAVSLFLKELAKEAGLKNYKDLSAHNLRKTFGTWLLALNIDGFKVAQHLGHDPNTLRVSYASPDIFNFKDKDMMREILDDLPMRMRD